MIVRNCAPEVAIVRRPDPSFFTVYASGNLRHDRGIGLLLDAAAEVDGCRVIAAGKCRDPELLTRLQTTPWVDYRGVLTPTEALELCGEADVVFTFYAPGPEINRKAVSNKWSDAMMAARPILVNLEVEKSAWVQEQGIGDVCRYDRDDLVRALRRLAGEPGRPGRPWRPGTPAVGGGLPLGRDGGARRRAHRVGGRRRSSFVAGPQESSHEPDRPRDVHARQSAAQADGGGRVGT